MMKKGRKKIGPRKEIKKVLAKLTPQVGVLGDLDFTQSIRRAKLMAKRRETTKKFVQSRIQTLLFQLSVLDQSKVPGLNE